MANNQKVQINEPNSICIELKEKMKIWRISKPKYCKKI